MIKADLVGSVEAASMLGVSRVTFNRWAADGKVPIAVQTAGKTGIRLFERSDIEKLAKTAKAAETVTAPSHSSGRRRQARPGPGDVPLVGFDIGDKQPA
jgi:predicted site-specific integrase-resolvase